MSENTTILSLITIFLLYCKKKKKIPKLNYESAIATVVHETFRDKGKSLRKKTNK